MNDLVRKSSPRSEESQDHSDNENLPSLVGRLGGDFTELLDLRLSLLKVEIKEEVDAYVRRGVAMATGGVITLIGFALVSPRRPLFLKEA